MTHSEDQHRNHDHHDHDHSHGGTSGGHAHVAQVTADNERRIRFVFLLTAAYAAVQAVGGWFSGSLALIADSGHMVSDAAALLLALIAYRVAARAPNDRLSYGYHRVRVLAALANGTSLLLLVAWIVWEAVGRLRTPVEVLAGPMLLVALVGLGVNIAGALILRAGSRQDGNLRGALLHVIGDLLGSVGAIAASLGIMVTGWTVLDPMLSVLVALLVVRSAWDLVSSSLRVLLQATPLDIDPATVTADLLQQEGVAEVAHFHAWTLTDESRVGTVHVVPAPGIDPLTLPPRLRTHLRARFGIDHATIEVNSAETMPREHW